MPFVAKENVIADPVPSATPAPTPTLQSDKKSDNIIPFVAKESPVVPPLQAVTDAQVQSANPAPTASQPDIVQTSNEVGWHAMVPELAPPPTQWSDTPTGQALISKVQNPLGLPQDVADSLVRGSVTQRIPNSNPDYPISIGKPPSSREMGFVAKESPISSLGAGFVANETPITPVIQNQGPELIGQDQWKKWDEQIKPYEDDPAKIASSDIPDIKERLTLMRYAQTKKDMSVSGLTRSADTLGIGEFGDNVQKTLDDVNNAFKTVGGWIKGGIETAGDSLQIPSQIFGALGNAVEAISPSREGSNPLKPPANAPANWINPAGIGGQENNVDIVTGGLGTGGEGAFPGSKGSGKDESALAQAMQERSDQSKRAALAGIEEGAASNVEFAENVISRLIGLTSTAPNAVLKVFGGPQVGYIDPKVQTWLATLPNPVPIVSGKSWQDMDTPEMLANLIAQDTQNNIHSARLSGHLDQASQEFLNTWAGHTVNTPESGARNGFPIPLKAIQDTAGVTNLLMGVPEFGLWGRMAEAAGLNNMVGLMTKKTLEGAADLAEGVAEKTDLSGNLKAIRLRDQAIEDKALTGETAVKAAEQIPVPAEAKLPSAFSKIGRTVVDHALGTAIGLGVTHAAGLPLPISIAFAPLVSQALKVPLKVAGALAKGGAGYVSKVTSVLADETADALRLAVEDRGNAIATRSPLKQFMAQGVKNIAEGAGTMLIPAALGSKSPEEFGSLMTMGAGMSIVGHALPDLVKGLQTQLIDRAFITDNNRYRNRQLAPDPMAYGTNPELDRQTKIAVNSANPETGKPQINNSQRWVLNDLQSHYAPIAEIHVLNPKPYAAEVQRMADLGHIHNDPQLNSYGVAIDPNPGINKARILVRSDYFDDAIHHELSHAVTNRMSPDDLRTSFLAYSKTNDPNEFTMNYSRRAKPGSAGVTYDQLPTEEGIKTSNEKYVPGFDGMTKDDMEKEMATEAVSGLLKGGSIRDLTRDPTMAHNMQQTFWRVLDTLGFDPVTTRTISPLGLNQSIPAALTLEPILRSTLKANRGTAEGATPTVDKLKPGFKKPVPESPVLPENPDESTIQGLMKKGFTRSQAENFVAKNKVQQAQGIEQPAPKTPAERARDILKGRGFTDEEAKNAVPDDVKVASDAVVDALEERHGKPADRTQIETTETPENVEKAFVPSKDWQERPDWAVLPTEGGLDIRRNSAGKQEVKWAKPPPQEKVTDKRTGKNQKNALGEEVPEVKIKPTVPEPPIAGKTKKPISQKSKPTETTITGFSPSPPPVAQSVPQTPVTPPIAPETPAAPEKQKGVEAPIAEEPPLETTPENVENIQQLQKEEGLKPGPAQRVVTGKGKKAPKKRSKGQAQNIVPFDSAKQKAIDELDPKDRSDWEVWNKQGKIKKGEPSEVFKRGNEVNDRVMARAAQIQDEVSKGQSQKGSLHPNQGEIPDQPGRIGYYGYVGDSGWDDASGMGIGGFPFSNHKGFLIPRYSAAMKRSEGARRGLLPGQEFSINGIKMRWDDVVPASSPVKPGYIDLYDPSQPPDRGVSPEKIAYQAQVAADRPGAGGMMGPVSPGESIVAQSLGGKPGPPEPPSSKAPEAPKEEAKEERKSEAPSGITTAEVNAADQQAQESVKQGNKSDEAYREAINSKVIDQIGPKHAETLNPDDERVKLDPDSGWMTGKYFDPNDAFHQWLLRNQSPEVLETLRQIQEAIAEKKDLHIDYESAPQKEKGLATAEQRKESQEMSTPSDREKGLAMIQQAGKNVIPSYVGVSKVGDVIYGGVSPDKIASNAAQITHRLGPQSPYKPGPLGDKVAQSDMEGYLWNQNNGWKGDGSARLKTVKGGTQVPEESEGFIPYEMTAAKGDFWNLAIAGKGTRLGTQKMKEGRATSSGRAKELALLNEGIVTKEGVVNPLHQKIESETPGWTDNTLHSGYELLKASLTKAIHPSGELPSEPIHPGHEEMAKAMTEKGLPQSQQVKAGFMPGKEIVSPNVKEGTDFDYARGSIFAPQHQEAKHYAKQVESAISKAYGYKPGELHDAFGDWGDGAENSIVSKTVDQPFNVLKLKTALKGLHSAQKQAIAWEDHPSGNHVMYELNFKKTAPEIRDIMQAHGLTYKTIIADTKHGEPTTAYVLDTDGSSGRGVAQLVHAPIPKTGLESFAGKVGHGEFLGDPEGVSRDVASTNFRNIIEEGIGEGRHPSGKGVEHLRDLATEAEHVNSRLKSESGKANWMPGDLVENPKTGEQERVGLAALRYKGTIYKGPTHADAYDNAESELGYPLRYPSDYHIKELRDRALPDTGIKPEDEGYSTRPTKSFPEGRYITRDEGWVLGKRHSDLKDTAQKLEESKLQGSATGLRSQDLKSNYMPGETYTNSVGAKVKVTDDSKSEAAPGEWMRYPNKAAYLPAEKAPKEVRESYVDTPERQSLIAGVQQKAKDWLKENQPHPLSAYAERQKIPEGSDMTVEELSDHLMKGKKQLDLAKPSIRESMANAATHDIMTRLSKGGSGVGWYEVIPPAAMKYVADHLDSSILKTPENRFMYQVTQAISSQGQDVYANAETGYDAYKYWQKHGQLPTEKQDITGGGKSWDQIAGNFHLVNDLAKERGIMGVEKLFNTKMSVKEMRKSGLKIGTGENPDFQMQGSLALGPKIGPFYASLNKHWENLVMDLWFNRTMNRMRGSMFQFAESPFRKQADTVKHQLLDGQIDLPENRANRILGEISRIESSINLSRKSLNKMAPALLDWAHEQHKVYMKSPSPDPNGPKTYGDKTEVNKNAKNLDQGLHGTQDTPRTGERPLYRDVISRTLQNLHDSGIDLTVADAQAILWYSEQDLFGHAGALKKQSDTSDYLDAAYALVKDKKSKGIKPVTKYNQSKIIESAGVH